MLCSHVVRPLLPIALCLLLVPQAAKAAEAAQNIGTLVIVPLGRVSPELIDAVAKSTELRFGVSVRIHETQTLPKQAWYPKRKRWRAEKLLDFLDRLDTGDAWRVTGLTEAPISTTKGDVKDWGIAGLGSINGKSSVLTAYLFRKIKSKKPKRYRRFVENLVLHEVGHTFGLEHCPLERCIMADAKGNAIRAATLSINQFCPRCTKWLGERLRDESIVGEWKDEELRMLGWPVCGNH